jgi:hypothetical protein
MSTTCMVRKASNAWALDMGTLVALSLFSSARASRTFLSTRPFFVGPRPFFVGPFFAEIPSAEMLSGAC